MNQLFPLQHAVRKQCAINRIISEQLHLGIASTDQDILNHSDCERKPECSYELTLFLNFLTTYSIALGFTVYVMAHSTCFTSEQSKSLANDSD